MFREKNDRQYLKDPFSPKYRKSCSVMQEFFQNESPENVEETCSLFEVVMLSSI